VATTGGDVIGQSITTGGSVANNAIGTGGNLAGKVIDAAGNIIQGAETGLGNLLHTNGSVVSNGGDRDRDREQGYGGSFMHPGLGTNNQPLVSQYAGYGSLLDKNGANYIPVTADFSAFRH
jgi:hypothetical protein